MQYYTILYYTALYYTSRHHCIMFSIYLTTDKVYRFILKLSCHININQTTVYVIFLYLLKYFTYPYLHCNSPCTKPKKVPHRESFLVWCMDRSIYNIINRKIQIPNGYNFCNICNSWEPFLVWCMDRSIYNIIK